MDVRGKFVLCFRGTPDADDKRFQHHDEHRVRMRAARDKGALGLIYIYPDVQANPNGELLENFMPAMISEAAADLLLEPRKVKALELKKDLQAYGVPITFASDARIDFTVEARHFADGIGYNVVAYLQGSDPRLRDEYVILGAHLDGCGRHLDILFPGADDNASGSAVVMEIARAFSAARIRPRRSILFVLFGGEEMGLLGANHFAQHLPAPIKKISAMFNFDMEGEGDRAFVQVQPGTGGLESGHRESRRQRADHRRQRFFQGGGSAQFRFRALFICRASLAPPFTPTAPICTIMPAATPFSASIRTSWAPSAGWPFLSTWFWAERL